MAGIRTKLAKLMSGEEIENFYKSQHGKEVLYLQVFWGVSKFKSIRRAIRRGHVDFNGTVYPNRPFNNRKDTLGRSFNIKKKEIYEQLDRKVA